MKYSYLSSARPVQSVILTLAWLYCMDDQCICYSILFHSTLEVRGGCKFVNP